MGAINEGHDCLKNFKRASYLHLCVYPYVKDIESIVMSNAWKIFHENCKTPPKYAFFLFLVKDNQILEIFY